MATFNRTLVKKRTRAAFEKSLDQDPQLAYLGVFLTVERNNKKLTQAQLGFLADIDQRVMSKMENGIHVEISTLFKVCKALGLKHIPTFSEMVDS